MKDLCYVINIWKKTKLIKENSITHYRAAPLIRVFMENFHLT